MPEPIPPTYLSAHNTEQYLKAKAAKERLRHLKEKDWTKLESYR